MNGKVKWFNAKNHFGFIEGEDGKDYFVHMSALKPGTKLFENDQVTFDPIEGERGLQAQNVSKTGDAPAEVADTQEEAPIEETQAPVEEASEEPVEEEAAKEETPEVKEEPEADEEVKKEEAA